jgi:hypothetical protein
MRIQQASRKLVREAAGTALLDRRALIIAAARRTGGDAPLGVAGQPPGG